MSVKANVRESGSVSIVDLAGRITLGEGSGTVRSTIKSLVNSGKKNILLNLADVTYMDSAGLGELVGSYATVTSLGGSIKLLNAQGKVSDLLAVTKLYTVFVAFSDEAAAVASFNAGAAGA
jgi:anti-sigma B factor antagonist